MRTPAGKECPWFYGDYYRGRHAEECRLLKASGEMWTPDLCRACPVPSIAMANSCGHMKLRAKIARSLATLFARRVQITAYCEKTQRAVAEPHIGCGECHELPFKISQ